MKRVLVTAISRIGKTIYDFTLGAAHVPEPPRRKPAAQRHRTAARAPHRPSHAAHRMS